MILDYLVRITIVLRGSGRRTRLQKADERFEPEEHEDLQKHLTIIILARPEFSKEQIEPTPLSEVQQRLILCNLKRRNRFLYAQRHSKWLNPVTTGHPSQPRPIEIHSANNREAAEQTQKSLMPIAKHLSEDPGASMNPAIRTGTSLSAISESLALPQALTPAPSISIVMSSTVMNLKYPRPPRRREDALVFTCPCCCQVYPVTLSEENRWK
jgi:hypothetical protein